VDSSTGSDGTITSRRIYITQADGTNLVVEGTTTDYEVWAYSASSITLDILTTDIAALVTVEWLNVSDVVVYTKAVNYGFTGYNEDFDYTLTQMLASNPLLVSDNGFFTFKSQLRTEIDSGDNAISRASDIYAAQLCYTRANELRTNSVYYFNINS
jgi:hypothetical protein